MSGILKWTLSPGTGNNMLALIIWQSQYNYSCMTWTHPKTKSASLKEGQGKVFNLTVRFVKWRWQALKWTLSLVAGNNLPALIIRQTWSHFDHSFVDHSVYIVHLVHPLKRHAVQTCSTAMYIFSRLQLITIICHSCVWSKYLVNAIDIYQTSQYIWISHKRFNFS